MAEEKKPGDLNTVHIPDVLPIISLVNVVVFPKMIFPLEVFEEHSVALVDEAMAKDRLMGLVLSEKDPSPRIWRPRVLPKWRTWAPA